MDLGNGGERAAVEDGLGLGIVLAVRLGVRVRSKWVEGHVGLGSVRVGASVDRAEVSQLSLAPAWLVFAIHAMGRPRERE